MDVSFVNTEVNHRAAYLPYFRCLAYVYISDVWDCVFVGVCVGVGGGGGRL